MRPAGKMLRLKGPMIAQNQNSDRKPKSDPSGCKRAQGGDEDEKTRKGDQEPPGFKYTVVHDGTSSGKLRMNFSVGAPFRHFSPLFARRDLCARTIGPKAQGTCGLKSQPPPTEAQVAERIAKMRGLIGALQLTQSLASDIITIEETS